MSGSSTAGFGLGHARQIQTMIEEVNSEPAARIGVAGSREAADALADALAADTEGAVIRLDAGAPAGEPAELTALVFVSAEWPLGSEALDALRAADRASLPIVAALIGVGEPVRRDEIPYVLATDVVFAQRPAEAALDVVGRVAARLKGEAYVLARALPHFREPVSKAIIRHYARRNAMVGALGLVPRAQLPVLTLNQLRMVARLAGAHGIELDAKRLVEFGAVVGASLGLRGVARRALGILPGPRWPIAGGVALGGTTAIGEAAVRRFRAETDAVEPDC
jgi:uncharacterized protein (DUF697 family)